MRKNGKPVFPFSPPQTFFSVFPMKKTRKFWRALKKKYPWSIFEMSELFVEKSFTHSKCLGLRIFSLFFQWKAFLKKPFNSPFLKQVKYFIRVMTWKAQRTFSLKFSNRKTGTFGGTVKNILWNIIFFFYSEWSMLQRGLESAALTHLVLSTEEFCLLTTKTIILLNSGNVTINTILYARF